MWLVLVSMTNALCALPENENDHSKGAQIYSHEFCIFVCLVFGTAAKYKYKHIYKHKYKYRGLSSLSFFRLRLSSSLFAHYDKQEHSKDHDGEWDLMRWYHIKRNMIWNAIKHILFLKRILLFLLFYLIFYFTMTKITHHCNHS